MIPERVLSEVRDDLARVRRRIEAACERAGRAPESVRLLAVSKRQPIERIAAAVVAGARDLGENYVQEARDKRSAVEELAAAHGAAPPRWHLVGPLQRNKAKLALELFERIETVDRAKLAEALSRRAEARGARVRVLLQVNVSREPQKAGVDPDAVAELLERCASLPGLAVEGLMAIPAAGRDPRPDFRALRALRDTLRGRPEGESLEELSMGMSGDFEAAIEEGATSVRIGTAVFGARAEAPDGPAGAGTAEATR